MRTFSCYSIALLSCLYSIQSTACTPLPEVSDEEHTEYLLESFQRARVVVIADVVDVKHSPYLGDPRGQEVIEEASMEVREVLKGPIKTGDRVAIKTEVICCICPMSVRNDPVWLYEVDESESIDRPVEMSGRWLLFQLDEAPIALSGGTPSAPWETVGEIDAARLRIFSNTGQKVVYPEGFKPDSP